MRDAEVSTQIEEAVETSLPSDNTPNRRLASPRSHSKSANAREHVAQVAKQECTDLTDFESFAKSRKCLASCYRASDWSANSCFLDQARLCRKFLFDGQHREAHDCAADCVARKGESQSCRAVLITTSLLLGEGENATDLVRECLLENSDSVLCLSPRHLENVKYGDLEEAYKFVDTLFRYNPNSSWTIYAEALLAEREGAHDEAQPLYREACERGRPSACQFVRDF